MRIRWGTIEIEVGDPTPLTARWDRPCQACGGTIARGEAFVSLEGHDPASGAVLVAVHPECWDRDRGGGWCMRP